MSDAELMATPAVADMSREVSIDCAAGDWRFDCAVDGGESLAVIPAEGEQHCGDGCRKMTQVRSTFESGKWSVATESYNGKGKYRHQVILRSSIRTTIES